MQCDKSFFTHSSAVVKAVSTTVLVGAIVTGCSQQDHSSAPPSDESNSGGPLVSELNAAETELYELGIQTMAEFFEVDPSERGDVVRWVLLEDQNDAVDACMTELGYTVTENSGVDAPPEQLDAVLRDQFVCFSQYPQHPAYLREWGEEQLNAQYDWTVEALIPCIENAGYSISNVPSRATFVEEWRATPFYPMSQLPDHAVEELNGQCLQQAPTAVLWEGVSPADWEPGMSEVISNDGL